VRDAERGRQRLTGLARQPHRGGDGDDGEQGEHDRAGRGRGAADDPTTDRDAAPGEQCSRSGGEEERRGREEEEAREVGAAEAVPSCVQHVQHPADEGEGREHGCDGGPGRGRQPPRREREPCDQHERQPRAHVHLVEGEETRACAEELLLVQPEPVGGLLEHG